MISELAREAPMGLQQTALGFMEKGREKGSKVCQGSGTWPRFLQ